MMRVILIGSESLTIDAGRKMRARGYDLRAVVTRSDDVQSWAAAEGLRTYGFGPDLATRLGEPVDWIFSVANLELLPADVLALAEKGAVNFHDGPLPRYAGLNAPVWALMNGEPRHGITWHLIEGGVDKGRILAQEHFDIRPGETALSLNTRCFEAGMQSFARVMDAVEGGAQGAMAQDLSQRSYFAKSDRPDAHGFIDPLGPAQTALTVVRALDHGPYWNPLCTAKLRIGKTLLHVAAAELAERPDTARAGEVVQVDSDGLTLAFAQGALHFSEVQGDLGSLSAGDVASPQVMSQAAQAALAQAAKVDSYWRGELAAMVPCALPLAAGAPSGETAHVTLADVSQSDLRRALLLAGERMTGAPCSVALAVARVTPLISDWVPLSDLSDIDAKLSKGGFARDLLVRDSGLPQDVPPLALGQVAGALIWLDGADLHYDTGAVSAAAAQLFADRLTQIAKLLAAGSLPQDVPQLLDADLALLASWNDTAAAVDPMCMPQLIEAQAARTPDEIAVVIEDASLTYEQLNTAANRAAHVLRDMGVGPDVLVGLYTGRSLSMMIGALAIMKAGGAYVPLDPAYPEHRIAGYLEDAALTVIVTEQAQAAQLPPHHARLLVLDDGSDRLAQAATDNPAPSAGPENLAYLIFTSGSTGRPKGVMIEHRNLSNFVTGMDARLAHEPAGVWLAVTSLNFDISVLELFYTLARGFKLVVTSDETRAVLSNGPVTGSDAAMDFSIYYWGNDDGAGEKKYELLLEGAKFADQNGFCAVWTPERHFHAFGGPYPNPSVTGAAVAAVTKNIGVRAGSCVAPLHHPARIAEEWAVIDNLTNGRAGLAMASGWQPDDFVLRPENTPPENKPAMMDSIEIVRKLWRGEAVAFPKADGTTHAVVTQPRPVSKELPIWVTTAGNPETWKEAGRIGAHVLTHLLGQSIDEVAGKITLYHDALREAGHDPVDFKVTLMLHTFVAETREIAREIAREPMKDYLRSAAGLIKQYAWAFPAFKRPEGVDNAFQLDLGMLEEDELEGILDFAFLRYFDDSGLFGTVQDCAVGVDQLKKIGVSEIACLIDYGIGTEQVLEGLKPLAEVVRRANTKTTIAADDFSIAAQLVRHHVSHLQCTPSMARLLCMSDETRDALVGVKHIMVGGEALPGALVSELTRAAPQSEVLNMYGPTETTIWSSVQQAQAVSGSVALGQPIANTGFHVMDESGAPCAIGQPGELWISGAGVTRGYWQRPDLTADRFVDGPDGRAYRTGDLVRYTAEGALEFLGRVDHQIKLRGYRIELGEIEAALEAQAGVRQSVVVAREDTPGDVRLIAYVTGDALVPDALRAALRVKLPAHMVPASIEAIDRMPLTPNKKVDRAALPAPTVLQAPAPRSEFVAEQSTGATGTAVLPQIAEIWKRALGLPSVAATDNFFDIGGHSLLAVQVHRDIRDGLGAKLSITDIFRFPVLSALAQRIEQQGGLSATAAPPVAAPKPDARASTRVEAMTKRRAMRAARLQR